MEKEVKRRVEDILQQRRNLIVLQLASKSSNVYKFCTEMEIPRSTFYEWKSRYNKSGAKGLLRIKPQKEYTPRVEDDVVNKIFDLRKKYQL